jgi:hypothetical protein
MSKTFFLFHAKSILLSNFIVYRYSFHYNDLNNGIGEKTRRCRRMKSLPVIDPEHIACIGIYSLCLLSVLASVFLSHGIDLPKAPCRIFLPSLVLKWLVSRDGVSTEIIGVPVQALFSIAVLNLESRVKNL